MEIGPVRASEFGDVIELWKRCHLVEPGQDPWGDIKRNQSSHNSTILVGRLNGAIAATVMVGFDGHRAWAYYVAVEPKCQGEGLGRQIMHAAETWSRERGAPKLMLMVGTGNESVLGFYAALGFDRRPVMPLGKPLD